MKAIYSIIFLSVCLSNHSFAQYTAVYSTENYVSLVNADTIDKSANFQFNTIDIYLPIPIGFSFELNGEAFDSVALAERGFAMFRDVNPKYSISIFDCELKDYNNDPLNSPILYSTEGTVGDRIFKCEYKMAGFVNDPEDDDFVSFQLWLYENCNEFEIRIGNYQVNSSVFLNNYPAPYIGFADYNNSANKQLLTGPPSNPTLVSTTTTLDTIPPVNSVYKFSNCSAGIQELNQTFSVHPNPVKDKLIISSETINDDLEINVFDVLGTKVYSSMINGKSDNYAVNLDQLSNGSYVLVLKSEGKISTHKIIKY